MNEISPEEKEKILNSSPKGTFALLLVFGLMLFAGWAFMFFFMFLKHGPVS